MLAFGAELRGKHLEKSPNTCTVAPHKDDGSSLLLQGLNHVLLGMFTKTVFANGALTNITILKSAAVGMCRLMKQGSPLSPASSAEIL